MPQVFLFKQMYCCFFFQSPKPIYVGYNAKIFNYRLNPWENSLFSYGRTQLSRNGEKPLSNNEVCGKFLCCSIFYAQSSAAEAIQRACRPMSPIRRSVDRRLRISKHRSIRCLIDRLIVTTSIPTLQTTDARLQVVFRYFLSVQP